MYGTCLETWAMLVYRTLPHLEPSLVDCIFFKRLWVCISEVINEVDKLICVLLNVEVPNFKYCFTVIPSFFLTLYTLLL